MFKGAFFGSLCGTLFGFGLIMVVVAFVGPQSSYTVEYREMIPQTPRQERGTEHFLFDLDPNCCEQHRHWDVPLPPRRDRFERSI